MKLNIILFLAINFYWGFLQSQTIIYCFPGQGADKRLFDSLKVDSNFKLEIIEYGTPPKKCSMKDFAKQFAPLIDTTKPFYLLGTSLGGMICVELSKILRPQKTIIISSVKNRKELPFRYKFQRVIPLYKIFPGFILRGGAKLLQPIVEPDRSKNKSTFKSMLHNKSGKYMKRSVEIIMKWERTQSPENIIHIHGNNDHTLPIRNIKNVTFVIENGSHMITLTRAYEINNLLKEVLGNDKY